MRSQSAMSKDLASWPPMRSWAVPARALPGQVQRPRIQSAVIGHGRQVRGPVGGGPAAQGSGSVSGSFTAVRRRSPATAASCPRWSRTPANGGERWGAVLESV